MLGCYNRTYNLTNTPATFEAFGSVTKAHGGAMMFGILTQKISGVYQITNTINGKRYVGSAVDVKKRWREHINCFQRGVHHSNHLQSAWNKYGADCFRFSIIEQCEKNLLIEREQYYIDTLHPEYNKRLIASSSLGVRHSEETRRKLSQALIGKVVSDEARHNMSESQKGKIPWNKGKKMSEEINRKNSESHKGQIPWSKGKTGVFSEETLRKMSETRKGRSISEEQKKKISKANIGKIVSDETRRKISEFRKGKTWNKGKKYKIKDKE